MLRSLLKLTWVEIKIFVREPMGVLGTVGIPVLIFIGLGKTLAGAPKETPRLPDVFGAGLPVLAILFIAIGSVLSLVAIISIYREGGILKRLRATPLRPQIILTAHVLVKLLFTALTIGLLLLAGRRFFPIAPQASPVSLAAAVLFATISILAIGFVIASIVPTARFAQPIGSAILYPMLAVSSIVGSGRDLPAGWRLAANLLPTTHAVSLLDGIWSGGGWGDHWVNVAALALNLVICIALSAKVFRWE
jgi:ABC-2 type transport system permease protein